LSGFYRLELNAVDGPQSYCTALRERSYTIWRFAGEGVCSNRHSAVIWERGGLAISSYNIYYI